MLMKSPPISILIQNNGLKFAGIDFNFLDGWGVTLNYVLQYLHIPNLSKHTRSTKCKNQK